MKKFLALSLALVLMFALAACGGTTSSSTAAPAETSAAPAETSAAPAEASSEAAPTGEGIRVGIVTSSGVDDGSFGQNCYEGVLAFLDTHPDSSENHVKEPDIGKVVQAVADIIADYDVMVMPGFQFNASGPIAEENPDKMFILVDSFPVDAEGNTIELDNMYAMQFKEQESGFYAGVAAALETKTGKVAVVNGMAFPSNVNYQYGFMAGVNYANAHLGATAEYVELPSYAATDLDGNNVGGNYVGAFADQATGKVIGEALIAEGVDIMFVAAGDSGNGVFAAAKEAEGEVYVIGCDTDQYDLGEAGGRNIVLTSALKNMDINVTRQLEAMYDGTFKGQNVTLDATTDSTGYVSEPGRQQLSDETLAELETVYEAVKAGEIVPPGQYTEGATPTAFPGL